MLGGSDRRHMAAEALSEPQVLAHAKRRLFPERDESRSYAVVDTQFATETWRTNERIPDGVREALAPFNHVRVGSGYPDLVGVRTLENELLSVDRLGDEPPLVVVEAKGYTDRGTVDVEGALVQAHDRLGEANAAYVAAPIDAITQTARTIARELNVGVLGVTPRGAVDPLETPRIVGNRTTTETTAIRLQATAQGVADRSFGLNHPKNYLAYPVSLYAAHDTETLLAEHVVGATAQARTGAAFLGLIETRPAGDRLTPLGREVVRFAIEEHGSARAAVERFDDWKRSSRRFVDVAPRWGQLARRVVFDYPATELLVEELQRMYDDGIAEPTLPQLVTYLHELHPTFAVELFVRGTDRARQRVLDERGGLRREPLTDPTIYHSPTTFQLKAMLYHAGILTERGAEPSRLVPERDVWALRSAI